MTNSINTKISDVNSNDESINYSDSPLDDGLVIDLITDYAELLRLLSLENIADFVDMIDLLSVHDCDGIFHHYPLKVPRSLVMRMRKCDRNDPLLLQILPRFLELVVGESITVPRSKDVSGEPQYTIDPLQENSFSPIRGLLHKYHGRVLLLLTQNCPINCRFCFRRHLRQQVEDWSRVFAYLECDFTITEVILSGGEPLLWPDKKIAKLLQQLSAIGHIKRIRIHSRMPIVVPERVTSNLIDALGAVNTVTGHSNLTLVIHCNHPQEIDEDVVQALKKLRRGVNGNGITLLNQSVLLKGINDSADVLVTLSEKLFASGVLPYYLHLLDRVSGSAHFNVDENEAKILLAQMMQRLSGYLVPKLVRDNNDNEIDEDLTGVAVEQVKRRGAKTMLVP